MTFHSSAAEFRQELLDYLQRLATQIFNRKRGLETARALSKKNASLKEIEELITQFNQVCSIRDFIAQIKLPGDPQ